MPDASTPAAAQTAPLSRRRVELHLPRLSPAAAADEPARPAGGRGLWLYDDAVEARRRALQGRRADAHGGDPRCERAYAPQRHVRPVQGAPAAAARGSGPAIPADPRRDARFLDPVHRGRGAGGRRHHRLLRDRGQEGRLEGDDRQLRQGFDAADRRGRGHRHARHDERPAHRPERGAREVRRPAREGRRRARADGRQRRQCAGRSGHRARRPRAS